MSKEHRHALSHGYASLLALQEHIRATTGQADADSSHLECHCDWTKIKNAE